MNVYKNNQIYLAVTDCPGGLVGLIPSVLPGRDADDSEQMHALPGEHCKELCAYEQCSS